MNKFMRLLLTLGVIAAILWLLRDKIVPPPQAPVAHPPSFRQPPPASVVTEPEPQVEAAASPGDNLEDVKGIGPVYRERLAEMGITSFAGLTTADTAAIAEKLDVAEDQVTDWVDQAGKLG